MNKLIFGGVGVVLVGMGLMSSFYKVNPGEHAIVLTMGKYIGKPVTEEGLKFNWPFGIDRVTKVNVAEVRPAVFGFDEKRPGGHAPLPTGRHPKSSPATSTSPTSSGPRSTGFKAYELSFQGAQCGRDIPRYERGGDA